MKRTILGAALAAALLIVPAAQAATTTSSSSQLAQVKRIVVIYEENHSFDNLYGRWERVNGVAKADRAHAIQVDQNGAPYKCLLQNDVNLATPPLSPNCTDSSFQSHFPNLPFKIDDYIKPADTTCPHPTDFAANGVLKGSGEPGGCTRDLVHRFYQEQYQLDAGKQDRYVTGSDAVGLTQGTYDTRNLAIYKYLHQKKHPKYVIADRFFQAAFGGSFLNHQWLIAAATPTWPGAPEAQHSILDSNGMPTNYPLYKTPATSPLRDAPLTAACGAALQGQLCGDYAVNTIQPAYQPYTPGTADDRRLPPQTHPTIGDRLSAKKVDWAWYSGGWSNANGAVGKPGWTNGDGSSGSCSDPDSLPTAKFPYCASKLFQFHHQPLNYFASFAPGTVERAKHLRDEAEFIAKTKDSSKKCTLKPVSFVKPVGAENEHPGYASVSTGSNHLVSLLSAIENGKCAKDTMVVVTYDEFGGQWDHVSPPGQGGTKGVHDSNGPGTRIPALVLAKGLPGSFAVDSAQHDTTSVLSTIEHRFGLKPLTSRDAKVHDLATAFRAKVVKPVGARR